MISIEYISSMLDKIREVQSNDYYEGNNSFKLGVICNMLDTLICEVCESVDEERARKFREEQDESRTGTG